jgi:hypothetical protein
MPVWAERAVPVAFLVATVLGVRIWHDNEAAKGLIVFGLIGGLALWFEQIEPRLSEWLERRRRPPAPSGPAQPESPMKRLDPEFVATLDLQPARPSGDQTMEQALNLAVESHTYIARTFWSYHGPIDQEALKEVLARISRA